MKDSITIDTNVLVYLYDNSIPTKRNIALELLSNKPQIPSQVVSELLNVLRRLLPMSKENLLMHIAELIMGCNIIPTLPSTLYKASLLVKNYQFQLFDAVIVASAMENNCSILYSEDMHYGLKVDNKLLILNPFI